MKVDKIKHLLFPGQEIPFKTLDEIQKGIFEVKTRFLDINGCHYKVFL
jgi:hypothetical protein